MIQLLKDYLQLNETQLFKQLYYQLKLHYNSQNIHIGPEASYLYAVGNIPIILVAHLDVVFVDNRNNMHLYYDQEKSVFWSPNGLGADDRAGVAMIIYLLQQTELRPSILFTTNEETDLKGAYIAAATILGTKPNFIIELDRRGRGECVFYQCENKKFEQYINSFGFTTELGAYTDISILCPTWGCAGVNLSVGYHEEHSFCEYLFVKDWLYTYDNLVKILSTINPEKHKFKYIEKETTKEGMTYRTRSKRKNRSRK